MNGISLAILDTIIDQIALINDEGVIMFGNKAWQSYAAEQGGMLGRYVGENYFVSCSQQMQQEIRRVLNGECTSYVYEYSYYQQHQPQWFLMRVTPFSEQQFNGAVISHTNITTRKLAEIEAIRKEAYYRSITDNSMDFISIHRPDGTYTFASPICEQLLGYRPSTMLATSIYNLLHEEDIPLMQQAVQNVQQQQVSQSITYRIRCHNGEYVWLQTKLKRLHADGQYEEFLFVSRDVNEEHQQIMRLKREKELLRQKAYTDELTCVYNRHHFKHVLKEQLNAVYKEQRHFSLLMIDLDYFKQFNDTYGHVEGDRTLHEVAQTLKRYVRSSDYVFRLGGEEFCVLLPNTEKCVAHKLAHRLLMSIRNLEIPHASSPIYPYVTVSIGLMMTSDLSEDELQSDQLVKRADEALYNAKRQGRNSLQAFEIMKI